MGRSKELFEDINQESEYKCTVCDRPMNSNSGVCSNVCFEADSK